MKRFVIFLVTIIIVTGCCKDKDNTKRIVIDCTEFKQNFIDNDKEAISVIIDSLCQNYPPMPNSDDELGHKENTVKLVEELNQTCTNMNFALKCYACMESYPPQSEITVNLDSFGIRITRYFRLYVPENDKMYMSP